MSTLPISKTLADIRREMFVRINQVQDEYQAKGWLPARLNLNKGVVRGLLELFCWGLYVLYQLLVQVMLMAIPKQATSSWLDVHSEQVELTRQASTKAQGVVTVTGDEAGNVVIPAGRIFRTPADGAGKVYRFVSTGEVILPDGQATVEVPVQAEDYGQAANVTTGQISEIVTNIPGVTAVTNAEDWLTSEGADEEIDAALQERYALRWLGKNGVTKYAYMDWARDVTGVVAVSVLDQHPRGQGTVDVVVKGAAGIPTQNLLDLVTARITNEVPVNDDWLVKAPTAVTVAIEAELVLTTGDEAEALAEAEERLRAMFQDPSTVEDVDPLQIGEDLTEDRRVYVLMAISGLKKINWTSPIGDVVVPEDGLAVLSSLTLTAGWADEA